MARTAGKGDPASELAALAVHEGDQGARIVDPDCELARSLVEGETLGAAGEADDAALGPLRERGRLRRLGEGRQALGNDLSLPAGRNPIARTAASLRRSFCSLSAGGEAQHQQEGARGAAEEALHAANLAIAGLGPTGVVRQLSASVSGFESGLRRGSHRMSRRRPPV